MLGEYQFGEARFCMLDCVGLVFGGLQSLS
jgi:hypothetical protein